MVGLLGNSGTNKSAENKKSFGCPKAAVKPEGKQREEKEG